MQTKTLAMKSFGMKQERNFVEWKKNLKNIYNKKSHSVLFSLQKFYAKTFFEMFI